MPTVPAAVRNHHRPCIAGRAEHVAPRHAVGGTSNLTTKGSGPGLRGCPGWHSGNTAGPTESCASGHGPHPQPALGLVAQCAQVGGNGIREAVSVRTRRHL